jgi:magnesium-transporting ATPase (P-type)
MFISLLIGLKIPLLAIQILWINLVTDGLPAIALGFEPAESGVMKRQPRHPDESIFAGGLGRHIVVFSILLTVLTLGSYLYGYLGHKMDPFSATLGLENLSGAELAAVIGEDKLKLELPPDVSWDSLSVEQRIDQLKAHENDEADVAAEKSSGGIIGEAERIPRTIGFTVLALGQIFHVIAIHGGDRESFFRILFRRNMLLFWAALSTFILQLCVIYVPFLQTTFETVPLRIGELALTIVLASLMLAGVEGEKFLLRRGDAARRAAAITP